MAKQLVIDPGMEDERGRARGEAPLPEVALQRPIGQDHESLSTPQPAQVKLKNTTSGAWH